LTPVQKPGRSKQDYATPWTFIRAVERHWGKLDFDLAATQENSRCGAQFFSPKDDSLLLSWTGIKGNLWLNPPYGDIEPWAKKCAMACVGIDRLFFLVPASVGSEWYAKWVHPYALVLALRPRLSFDEKNPYPKDCILAVYGERPDFRLWKWNEFGEKP
jgi:phage N-6-adenine-methyltransferase